MPDTLPKKEEKLSAPNKSVEKEETIFKIDLKFRIPKLPLAIDPTKIDVRYSLIKDFANVHIYWDTKNSELVYEVEEPVLTDKEKEILGIIEKGIEELINISFVGVKNTDIVIEFLEKNVKILLIELGIKVTRESFLKLMYYIYRNFVGLNQIEPLMRDAFIEDIECNGSKTPLYVVHRVYRNVRTNLVYPNNKFLANFVEKLAQKCGKYVSYANPTLDGRLPDGSRVNATYTEEISTKGPTFTIRKFTKIPWTPIHMIALNTSSAEMLAYLWLAIEHENNIMVIGGTGSGKTTFLNALSFFIPPQARVVTIEDTRELNLNHENWLPSVARQGIGATNLVGVKHGEVSLFDLLKESFRQRPDYVIVGEVRGAEANVLFQGMSSGHPSLGTIHAEDTNAMIRRLETPPINLSPALVEALDVVCIITQTKIKGSSSRRIREIQEIIKVGADGTALIKSPFVWNPKTDRFILRSDSEVFNKLMIQHGMSRENLLREFKVRTAILNALYQKRTFDSIKVQEVISEYYKTPNSVLMKLGIQI